MKSSAKANPCPRIGRGSRKTRSARANAALQLTAPAVRLPRGYALHAAADELRRLAAARTSRGRGMIQRTLRVRITALARGFAVLALLGAAGCMRGPNELEYPQGVRFTGWNDSQYEIASWSRGAN